MCLTRIYARRKRDGRLFRFNSTKSMRDYCRSEHESKRSLPTITRADFRRFRDSCYANPVWIASERVPGVSIMAEGC